MTQIHMLDEHPMLLANNARKSVEGEERAVLLDLLPTIIHLVLQFPASNRMHDTGTTSCESFSEDGCSGRTGHPRSTCSTPIGRFPAKLASRLKGQSHSNQWVLQNLLLMKGIMALLSNKRFTTREGGSFSEGQAPDEICQFCVILDAHTP